MKQEIPWAGSHLLGRAPCSSPRRLGGAGLVAARAIAFGASWSARRAGF